MSEMPVRDVLPVAIASCSPDSDPAREPHPRKVFDCLSKQPVIPLSYLCDTERQDSDFLQELQHDGSDFHACLRHCCSFRIFAF
jgi:hypothetical protein